MSSFRSFLDGLSPLLRLMVMSAISIVLASLILLVLGNSIGTALGIAIGMTLVAQIARAYQLRTLPWRDPSPRSDR